MPTRCVALLRGINVGTAKRVAMADLRAMFEALGYTDVVTLLNSGNVVFTVGGAARADGLAKKIEAALVERTGISARVAVLTASDLATIAREYPHGKIATDPSRSVVTVLRDASERARLAELAQAKWGKDAFAVGSRAAYLWCPDGILNSKVWPAVERALGDAVTSRNWATLTKLTALAGFPGREFSAVREESPDANPRGRAPRRRAAPRS